MDESRQRIVGGGFRPLHRLGSGRPRSLHGVILGVPTLIAALAFVLSAQPVLAATCSGYKYAGQVTNATSYNGVERYVSGNSMTLNGGTHVLEWLTSTDFPSGKNQKWSQTGQALGTLGTGCGMTTTLKMYYEAMDNTSNPYYCAYYGGSGYPANPTFYENLNIGRMADGNYQYEGYDSGVDMGWAELTNSSSQAQAMLEVSGSSSYTCPSVSGSPGYWGADSSGTPRSYTVLLLNYSGGWSWWGTSQTTTVYAQAAYSFTRLDTNGSFKVTGG